MSATVMANLRGRTAAPVARLRGHLCTQQRGCGTCVGRAPFHHRAREAARVGCSGGAPRAPAAPARARPCPGGRAGARPLEVTQPETAGRGGGGGRQMRARRETSKRRSDAGGRGTRRWICPNIDKIAARLRQWRARGGWAGPWLLRHFPWHLLPPATQVGEGDPTAWGLWRAPPRRPVLHRWVTPVFPLFLGWRMLRDRAQQGYGEGGMRSTSLGCGFPRAGWAQEVQG